MEEQYGRSTLRASNHRASQGAEAELDLLRLSQQQEELKASIKSLQSDVLNLSELSATSAGSFMRHKYERYMNESKMDVNREEPPEEEMAKTDSKEAFDAVFQDKKSKHPKIFKMLMRKSQTEPALNPIERNLKQQDEMDWADFKISMNRMNSLTSEDKQSRTKRVVREEGNLIVKPLDYVTEINTNETIGEGSDGFNLSDVRYSKVASFMEHYQTSSDMNDMISDISVKFHASKLNQIRCVLLHMCKFRIIEEPNKISILKPKLKDVQYKGEASIYQINYLFKKILDALRIPSEIVPGFWKKPNEFYHNEQFVINHCWLSILVDDSFRVMDIYNFKHGSVCNVKKYNEFYFLAEPLSVVSTYIPSIVELQHVMPPIDPNIAFYLPRTYSGFYKNHLTFKNFNNALTRLKDLEFFELELDIPTDVELFTLVKTAKVTTNELSLCQVKWVNNKRIAKIKAMLPDKESIGVLQIFAGEKGLQKHFDNIHELAIVIPLYHQGTYKPSSFVQRFPTVQSQNNDLYITKPQVNKLVLKNAYNFEIEQHPSQGVSSVSTTRDFKLVIESPSGKYFPLTKDDDSVPYGVYSSNIKCQETGVYRGLVIGDSGTSWYVFAQWECIA
ncbi:uncharacterized protein SPAPADRAFT_62682 [Spathaspora passalidarum NRRL Y-27907]|uniref:CYK3 C-terminal Ig-like domain-containing protein n=1 Tax=Spathaspora passalidarum (strain NRRL Y-27907 / 11-Y1) TaxID=619300 RepID=G3AT56_SPAPN|nr:uncharacterized protein SPAPADRAFT_62682 [Spathaspora passalidarum NRRL Y-27907]EGW30819.1 hypothetical protein SPAPADRAFT_62682 [Spathaspora passalidarum NRRL Y-27907]